MSNLVVNDPAMAFLPAHVRQLVASCPQTGSGVHRWLFHCASQLHRHLTPENIERILSLAVVHCGREVPDREISDAVRNSHPARRNLSPQIPKWPEPDPAKIAEVVRQSPGHARLVAMHPVTSNSQRDFIAELFPGNPLLCCGWSKTHCETRTRAVWGREAYDLQFIVPSPMSRPWGRTKYKGHLSQRCLDNTGPRHYLVIECDFTESCAVGPLVTQLGAQGIGPIEMCGAVLWELQKYGPLTMIVHSGGKSLHGWFNCLGAPEEHLLRFMRLAVSLGADTATWTRCQLVRMPNGLRPREDEPPVRQRVIYFDPERSLR